MTRGRTRTYFLMASVLLSSSPLQLKKLVSPSPATRVAQAPLAGCRYNTLENTGAQTLTISPACLCAHHWDPHLSFVPLRTPPLPCKPAPLVHFLPVQNYFISEVHISKTSPGGFLLESWLSAGTSLQREHLFQVPHRPQRS